MAHKVHISKFVPFEDPLRRFANDAGELPLSAFACDPAQWGFDPDDSDDWVRWMDLLVLVSDEIEAAEAAIRRAAIETQDTSFVCDEAAEKEKLLSDKEGSPHGCAALE